MTKCGRCMSICPRDEEGNIDCGLCDYREWEHCPCDCEVCGVQSDYDIDE